MQKKNELSELLLKQLLKTFQCKNFVRNFDLKSGIILNGKMELLIN